MASFNTSRWAEALVHAAGDHAESALDFLKVIWHALYGSAHGSDGDIPMLHSKADYYSGQVVAQHLEVSLRKVLIQLDPKDRTGPEIAARVAVLLARRDHLQKLNEVIEQTSFLLDKRSGILHVHVDSAQALSDLDRENLKNVILMKWRANSIVLKEQVNPGLIAGLRIQIGWQRFDGSLRGKLIALGTYLGAPKRGVL
jgi:ATP synthase F1 delta subunit